MACSGEGLKETHAPPLPPAGLTEGRLVDHVDEGRGRLVVHAPAAVDELELPRRDQLLRERLRLGVGLGPPALEESLLDVDELAVRVPGQLLDDRADDVLHLSLHIAAQCGVTGGVARQPPMVATRQLTRWMPFLAP